MTLAWTERRGFNQNKRSYIIILGAGLAAVRREAPETVTGAEDVPADQKVEEERAKDADPDEHVVGVDANIIPFAVNPAPDLPVREHMVSRPPFCCLLHASMRKGLTVASP
jgi:hypothetical protein